MEQSRVIIAIALSFLVFFLWNSFFAPKEPTDSSGKSQTTSQVAKEKTSVEEPSTNKDQEKTAVKPGGESKSVPESRTITVSTPLYAIKFDTKGARFKNFVLKEYRERVEEDSPLKSIVSSDNPIGTMLLEFDDNRLHGLKTAVFSTDISYDVLEANYESQSLTFSWTSPNGVVVEKTFRFFPDTYLIDMSVSIKNGSDEPLKGNLIVSLTKVLKEKKSRFGFEGPSALINDKLEKVEIKDIEEKNIYSGKLGWVALQDRYFMSSIIPKEIIETDMKLFVKDETLIEAQYVQPDISINTGAQKLFEYRLFLGPKSMKILNDTGYELSKAVNFGMFDFIAKPCVWVMNFIYRFIPNYGVAIIFLTVMTKLILWPLGTKSYKSMSEMKKLQPLMAELKEKYKNDKKRVQQETMALYKTYKINPLGGCLPMVAQIPVFFALYRMLYEAIELRHAPFFGWINDLSAPDRLFRFGFSVPFMEPPYGIPVLTIVMGATMFLQQKMSPPPGDPGQAKMMMFMPLIFTVIFINFSAGLVLYWLVNNVLSISQQYFVQKKNA
jgi:YidC/Oxa1 family membrane protein insertase